jgi:hypothetical protein
MNIRPKVLTEVINIRCTPEEKAVVLEQARIAGLSPSALGRKRLLEQQVFAREVMVERNELRRLGGLLKLVHQESNGVYSKQTAEILGLIRERLKALGA